MGNVRRLAVKGQEYKQTMLALVDADTRAFTAIMTAFGLPKTTVAEKEARNLAIKVATKTAIDIPFRVMQAAFASMEVIRAMAESGNPNSVTDAGVGAMCALTAVRGAFLNVRINAAGYDDQAFVDQVIRDGTAIEQQAISLEAAIMKIVNSRMGQSA